MRDNNNRRRDDRNNQPESDIKDRLVTINRSTKTTKGGRTFTFTGIVVVGDEKGKVGHGSGRSREVVTAIQKGIEDAKKNMVDVPVINGTVPHAQEAVFAGARVLVKPAISRYGSDCRRRHARCAGERGYQGRPGEVVGILQHAECREGHFQGADHDAQCI